MVESFEKQMKAVKKECDKRSRKQRIYSELCGHTLIGKVQEHVPFHKHKLLLVNNLTLFLIIIIYTDLETECMFNWQSRFLILTLT